MWYFITKRGFKIHRKIKFFITFYCTHLPKLQSWYKQGRQKFYAVDGAMAVQKRLTKVPMAAERWQLSLSLSLLFSPLDLVQREREREKESGYGRSLNTTKVQGSFQTLAVPLFKRAVPKFASYLTLHVQTSAQWGTLPVQTLAACRYLNGHCRQMHKILRSLTNDHRIMIQIYKLCFPFTAN